MNDIPGIPTNNGDAVIGVGLAIASQDRFALRELWYSRALKFVIEVYDRDDNTYTEAFITRPDVSACDMCDAVTEWLKKLAIKESNMTTEHEITWSDLKSNHREVLLALCWQPDEPRMFSNFANAKAAAELVRNGLAIHNPGEGYLATVKGKELVLKSAPPESAMTTPQTEHESLHTDAPDAGESATPAYHRYRVDEGEHGFYFIVDQKHGRRLRPENKMEAYMVTIADELNKLNKELAEANLRTDDENRQKRQTFLAFELQCGQLAEALGHQTLEGLSYSDLVDEVKALKDARLKAEKREKDLTWQLNKVARLREEIEHIIGNIEGELAIKKPIANDTWPNPIVYGRALERWEMSEDIRRIIGMMREHAADVLRTEGEG